MSCGISYVLALALVVAHRVELAPARGRVLALVAAVGVVLYMSLCLFVVAIWTWRDSDWEFNRRIAAFICASAGLPFLLLLAAGFVDNPEATQHDHGHGDHESKR